VIVILSRRSSRSVDDILSHFSKTPGDERKRSQIFLFERSSDDRQDLVGDSSMGQMPSPISGRSKSRISSRVPSGKGSVFSMVEVRNGEFGG
jgi:hypothetical protein